MAPVGGLATFRSSDVLRAGSPDVGDTGRFPEARRPTRWFLGHRPRQASPLRAHQWVICPRRVRGGVAPLRAATVSGRRWRTGGPAAGAAAGAESAAATWRRGAGPGSVRATRSLAESRSHGLPRPYGCQASGGYLPRRPWCGQHPAPTHHLGLGPSVPAGGEQPPIRILTGRDGAEGG